MYKKMNDTYLHVTRESKMKSISENNIYRHFYAFIPSLDLSPVSINDKMSLSSLTRQEYLSWQVTSHVVPVIHK